MARSTRLVILSKNILYFMGSETLPSACYILSDESSIPFYSTSNGYDKSYQLGNFFKFQVFQTGNNIFRPKH